MRTSLHSWLLPVVTVLAMASASFGQLITVLGNDLAITPGDSSPSTADHTDFGSADVFAGAVDRTFTIRNTSTSTLGLFGLQRLGTAAAEFTIPIPPAQFIAGESETTFTVRFNPAAIGTRTATIRIRSNASNTPIFDFAIKGTGTVPAPEITILGDGHEIGDGDPIPRSADLTDFGPVDVQDASATHRFTIRNDGDDSLTVTAIEMIEGHSSDFGLTDLPAGILPPGTETTFAIQFDPSAVGLRTTTVRVHNSDADEPTYDFAIQGTGTTTAAELTLLGAGQPIPAGDDTPSLDDLTKFPGIAVNQGSRTHSFTVANSGNSELLVSSISLTGNHAADFAVLNPPAGPIAPGTTAAFAVRFRPSAYGLRHATLVLASNDPAAPSYQVALLGAGGTFALTNVQRDGQDIVLSFTANPDTTVSAYIYSIRYSTNLDDWTTIESLSSPGGTTEEFRVVNGGDGANGYWRIEETTIP